jgi:hypothetical protein
MGNGFQANNLLRREFTLEFGSLSDRDLIINIKNFLAQLINCLDMLSTLLMVLKYILICIGLIAGYAMKSVLLFFF